MLYLYKILVYSLKHKWRFERTETQRLNTCHWLLDLPQVDPNELQGRIAEQSKNRESSAFLKTLEKHFGPIPG